MKIKDIVCSKGLTGFFFDDQIAIKSHAIADGATFIGQAVTLGFDAIRQAGESISVMIILEDGQIATGDCAAVQYSGCGGRDPLFLADDYIPIINQYIKPALINQSLTSFKELAIMIDTMIDPTTQKPFHTAIRYGLSQALLDAVAKANHCLMAEVIAKEYQTNLSYDSIDIFMQSGDDRYNNADKMILKKADVLPHALINHIPTKLGYKGELLLEYIQWLKNRIIEKRTNPSYHPAIHIDVYGTIGSIFNQDIDRMVEYLKKCSEIAHPFELRIEGPVDMGNRADQIEALRLLTAKLDKLNINVIIVADEWCNTLEDIQLFADYKAGHMIQIKTPDLGSIHNTIEAVLYCKEKGILAYQGGTCNETDRSSQVCVHVAMATQPCQVLAKPGMGGDEGLMIIKNEMNRVRAYLQYKHS